MNNKSRIFTKFAVATAISALAITGCSAETVNKNGTSASTSQSQSQTENADFTTETAAKFVSDYYAGWFKEADERLYDQLQTEVTNIVGEDSLNNVNAEDPLVYFESLPKDKQAELAKKTTELNKNADHYDMSGMSDAEVAVLNIMVVSLSSIFGSTGTVTVSANAEKIEVNGTEATVPFSALSVQYGESEETKTEMDDSEGFELSLKGISGKWKVNGKEFLTTILKESAAEPEVELETQEPDAASTPSEAPSDK